MKMHFTKWIGVCSALVFTLFFVLSAERTSAQINVNEGFEGGTAIPTGWASSGGWTVYTVPATPANPNQIPCTGSRSIRANIFSATTTNRSLAAPLFTSNGSDIDVSFNYKIINWAGGSLPDGNVPTTGNWGSLSLQYSVDGGLTYSDLYVINESNHITSGTCANISQTIPGALIPNGTSARIRFFGVWASGDWYAYLDDIIISQLATTPPACNAALTSPVPGSNNASATGNLAWTAASGAATGYNVTVTQLTGGPTVIYDQTLGNVLSVNVGPLNALTEYQVDIVPFNANGDAEGCSSYTFTTLNPAICQAPLLITDLPYSTTDNTGNYGDDYESVNLPAGPALYPAISTGTLSGSYLGGDDVVYAYTPVNNGGININIPTGHGTWLGVYVFTGCPFSQTVAFHLASSGTGRAINNIPVVGGTTYYIVISTFPAPQSAAYTLNVTAVTFECPELLANIGSSCSDGNPGTFGDIVTAECECVGTPYECQNLNAQIGSACNDNNPFTVGDTVTEDCECVGTLVEFVGCTNGTSFGSATPVCDGPASNITNSWTNEFSTITVTAGNTYNFSLSVPTYFVTITDADLNILAYGLGAATYVADFEGIVRFYSTFGPDCPTTGGSATVHIRSVSAICAPVFECPELEANIGDACDDEDATTEDDIVQEDCTCAGTSIYDCPELSANFGDACDDGNANTLGDIVLEDCTCAGTALPENDTACGAEAIECGDVVTGTTIGATSETLGFCGTSDGTGGGLWYLLQPSQSGQVVASLCGSAFDTKIRVFSGACDGLTCVGGNDDFSGCGTGFTLNSQITFTAVAGTSYYILVHGFSANEGEFTLSVTCTLFDCPEILANFGDACNDGDPLTFGDSIQTDCSCAGTPAQTNDTACDAETISCGDTVSGTTQGTTADVLGFCGTSDGTNGGVWYALTAAENATITASLCGGGTTFDSKLRVFEGDCDALLCVTGNDDFCGLQSQASFTASAGNTYYILVHGFSASAGPYSLSVTCETIFDCPELSANIGDACDDGEATTENDTVQDDCSCAGTPVVVTCVVDPGCAADINSAEYAQVIAEDPFCCNNAWDSLCASAYALLGGQPNPAPECAFDCPEILANFGDACDDGDSNTENDAIQADCSCAGTPIIATCAVDPGCAADVNSAAYATIIAADPFCCNTAWDSICANAYAAAGGLPSQDPSCFDCPDLLANIGDACDDGNPNTANDQITVNCDCAGTPIDLFDCPELGANIGDACNDGNANTIGDVVLEDCTCAGTALPDNDTACGAEAIECGDVVTGTTVGATSETLGFCGTTDGTGGGLWYLLQPTQSGQVVVNTCGSAFDTKLRVFSGACDALTCVGGNDDFSGCGPGFTLNSQVTFTAVAGTSYYILVHGFAANQGEFTLSVACTLFDCPEILANFGDACNDGDPLTFGDSIQADCSCAGTPAQTNDTACEADAISCGDTVSGTTLGTTADVLGFCGTSDGTNGGVWYALTATENATVTASLCGGGTTFDSKLRVFEGDCDALLCVTGNDDFCGLQSQVSFTASAGTTYYILVHGFSAAAGPYSLSVTCETIYDCPELSANIGDACDDGDANTENDTVGEDCTCAGTPIVTCNVNGGTVSTTSETTGLCKGDGEPDFVQLTVSGNTGVGLFGIIEQGSQNVVAVSQTGLFNIENLPAGNYQGGYISVENISQLAGITNLSQLSGCFDLSNKITIRSILLAGGTLGTDSPPLICTGNVTVSVSGNVGPNTRFVLLNAAATEVLAVNQTGVFNFSNLADGTYRVTAITFRGGVDLNSIIPPVLPACVVNSNILTFIKINCTGAALTSAPNPTSGTSWVTFSVPTEDYTTLEVYDMSGRKVTELFNQVAEADAQYRLEFNGLGLPNGVYIYRLTTSHEVVIDKFMIAK